MVRARTVAVTFALALSLVLAGCTYAAGSAAEVPPSALEERNWKEKPTNDLNVLKGAVTVHVRQYAPQGNILGVKVPGGIHLATAPDVPVLDETEFAEDQILRLVESQGISLGKRSTERFELVDERVVTSSVYTIQQNGGQGHLRIVPIPCPDSGAFVVGVGWGADGRPFRDATTLLGAVPCPS